MLLLAFPASADTRATVPVTVSVVGGELQAASSGVVAFPAVTLDGTDHDSAAVSAPSFTLVDARGTGEGWNLTMQSSDLTDGSSVIRAANVKFDPAGGSLSKVKGQAVDASSGPKETGSGQVSLDTTRKVVTTSAGYGKGRYVYEPQSASFSLHVDASTLTGNYTGTITATLSSGP